MLCSVCHHKHTLGIFGAPLKDDGIVCPTCIKKLGLSTWQWSYKTILATYTANELKSLIAHDLKLNYKREVAHLTATRQATRLAYHHLLKQYARHHERVSAKFHADFVDQRALFAKTWLNGPVEVKFSDILSYTPVITKHQVIQDHHISDTLVGGIIGGATGAAIAYGLSQNNTYEVVTDMRIVVQLRHDQTRDITYFHVKDGYKTDSSTYRMFEKDFDEGVAILDDIIAAPQHHEGAPSNTAAITAELIRLKQLLNDGIITRADYTAKKKQILRH